jgi:hypothetical protein
VPWKARGDDLTMELSSLYDVLAHVYSEISVPESPIGQARRSMRSELDNNLGGCEQQLRIIDIVLKKFNSLGPEHRVGKPLWSKIQFANGEDQDVSVIRSRMSHYSIAISMSLRLMALGSRGKIERQLSHQKAPLGGLRKSVNFALAYLNSTTKQKSLMSMHLNDAKALWRSLRRELVNDGFTKQAVQSKKTLILSYMKELDSRGVLGYSASFQQSLAREHDLRHRSRPSSTPASFRSESTFVDSRTSNSSLDSFKPSKYCNSERQTFDEADCLRTPTWSERSVTAVGYERKDMFQETVTQIEQDDEGYSGSPKASIPFRVPYVASTGRSSNSL